MSEQPDVLKFQKPEIQISELQIPKTEESEKPKCNVVPIVINEAALHLVAVECYSCGIVFAFPDRFQMNLKRSKRLFYCPNGHSQYYPG